MPRAFKGIIGQWLPRFLLIACGLIIINLIWLIPALRNIRSSASLFSLQVAHRVNGGVTTFLETTLDELIDASQQIAIDPTRRDNTLDRLLKRNQGFRDIAVIDEAGFETIRIDRFQLVKKEDLRFLGEEPSILSARKGAPYFGNVFVTPESEPHIVLAVPIDDSGGGGGVLTATVNLRYLVRGVQELRPEEGLAYVVDRQGFLIVHPNITSILKRINFGNRAIVQKLILEGRIVNGLAADDSYINEDGMRMFAVGIPAPVTGWGVIVERPLRDAFAAERMVIGFAILNVVLGMLIVVVIMRGTIRLAGANKQLNELLHENYEVGKILVRRDIELTEANARLIALDQNKSEFVSVAAHQLRTPLTGIRWTFNALQDEEWGELTLEQQKVVENGLKSSMRMIDLINDLLNVARIEEGRFGLHPTRQPFAPLIQKALEHVQKLSEEKGVALALDIALPLPPLDIDEEKMTIALENVFDNAIKYTPPGGTVTVSTILVKGGVKLVVADTGIGIPKDQLQRIFTKFFRADNAMRFQTSGSGLGLYVVKNVIEGHDGTLTITSAENKGTIVTIILPVKNKSAA